MSEPKLKRGVATIADLRARSDIDPVTGCWHWKYGSTEGNPRIWTFDHARGEKRCMCGPLAVWNIAHGEAPRNGWLVFRSCVVTDCVNPVHHSQAASRAAIGQHIARNGARVGTSVEQRRANLRLAMVARGITPTAPEIVLAARAWSGTSVAFAALHDMCHQTVSRIRRGQSHRQV